MDRRGRARLRDTICCAYARAAAGRALALAAAVVMLASCGVGVATAPPLPPPPHAGETGAAISRIQHAGTLRVAADLSYPPIAFRDDSGPKGFDVDVATLLSQALGVRLEIVDTPLAALRLGIPAGADMAIGALPAGVVPGHASAPYFMVGQAIISPGRTAVTSVEDLRGLRVAAAAGSPGAGVAQRAGAASTELTYLPGEALAAVAAGSAQAAVVDEPLARGYAADHRDLKVAAIVAGAVPLVAVVPENQPDLAGFVADALQDLDRSGGVARLRERWHL